MSALREEETRLLIAVCTQLKGANFEEVGKEIGTNQSAAQQRWNRLYTKLKSKNASIRPQEQDLLVAVCKQTTNGSLKFDKVAADMKLGKSAVTQRWNRLRIKLCGGGKAKDGVKGAKVEKTASAGAKSKRGRPKKIQSQTEVNENGDGNEGAGEAMEEDEEAELKHSSESGRGLLEGGGEDESVVEECERMGTCWEYAVIEAVKEG